MILHRSAGLSPGFRFANCVGGTVSHWPVCGCRAVKAGQEPGAPVPLFSGAPAGQQDERIEGRSCDGTKQSGFENCVARAKASFRSGDAELSLDLC
jgi:hypothetical protein